MGDGAVVTPEDPIVRAPEDGEVCFVFDTKHAIGFLTDSGISLLIHVGIDTVKLEGKGFEVFVENGQKVKKGDPMLKLDLDYLKENIEFIMLDKEHFAIVKQQLTQLVKRMDASTRLLFAQNLAATTTDDGNNLIELLFDVFEKDLIQMLDLSDQTRRAIEGK